MADRPALLQDYVTPEDFAAHYGFSERAVREKARALGACTIWGKRMILLPQHCEILLEDATPCHSKYTSAARSGITEAPLTGGGFEVLQERLIEKSLKGSRRKSKAGRGSVTSTGRGRG